MGSESLFFFSAFKSHLYKNGLARTHTLFMELEVVVPIYIYKMYCNLRGNCQLPVSYPNLSISLQFVYRSCKDTVLIIVKSPKSK